MARLLTSTALALVVCGCATTTVTNSTRMSTASYQIGKETRATVGSPMVRVETVGTSEVAIDSAVGHHEGRAVDGFRQELIYLGFMGNAPGQRNWIRVAYREYHVDERGAALKTDYNVEAQYDLEQSKIIAYRDWNIEVSDATVSDIKFKVLSGPALPKNQRVQRCETSEHHTRLIGWTCVCDDECSTGLVCTNGTCAKH